MYLYLHVEVVFLQKLRAVNFPTVNFPVVNFPRSADFLNNNMYNNRLCTMFTHIISLYHMYLKVTDRLKWLFNSYVTDSSSLKSFLSNAYRAQIETGSKNLMYDEIITTITGVSQPHFIRGLAEVTSYYLP